MRVSGGNLNVALPPNAKHWHGFPGGNASNSLIYSLMTFAFEGTDAVLVDYLDYH